MPTHGSLMRYPSKRRARVAVLAIGLAAGMGSIGAGFLLFAQQQQDFRDSPFLRIDPDRIVIENSDGYAPCGECHTAEWEVWQKTNHATGFETLHRSESAKDVLREMDLRMTKRQEAICMRCHYTVGPDRKAVAGVSCESCHGPARDWINVHNRLGEASSPAERERVIQASVEAGMLRPSGDIYAVTANCFECHTVPSEELVNTGGHTTGSPGFELVDRMDQIRHNFLHTARGGTGNRELPVERRRVMFVTGRILAYEYALRGLANATESGRYASAMGRRVKDAYRALDEVARVAPVPAVTEVLKLGTDLRVVPDNRSQLESAAEQIRAAGQRFASSAPGGASAALDPLMAGERIAPAAAAVETEAAAGPTDTAPASSVGSAVPSAQAAGASGSTTPVPARVPELPGQVRRRPEWFPAVRHSTIGPGECASCHGEAEEWWYGDPHERAGRRLLGEDARARRIAELYGIGAGAMPRGDQICAGCHMTVDEPTKTVIAEGVSCESCHGAAGAYLDPHQEGGNPQAGMTALKRAADRAQTCARCHHISDERLLAAGHPSGAGYDIAAGSRMITHWPGRRPQAAREKRGERYPAVADDALRTAFASATGGRPIPNVEVVAPLPPPVASSALGGGAGGIGGRGGARGSAMPPAVPRSAPARAGGADVQLDEPTSQEERVTPEELLLHVKQRIERIFAAMRRGS